MCVCSYAFACVCILHLWLLDAFRRKCPLSSVGHGPPAALFRQLRPVHHHLGYWRKEGNSLRASGTPVRGGNQLGPPDQSLVKGVVVVASGTQVRGGNQLGPPDQRLVKGVVVVASGTPVRGGNQLGPPDQSLVKGVVVVT